MPAQRVFLTSSGHHEHRLMWGFKGSSNPSPTSGRSQLYPRDTPPTSWKALSKKSSQLPGKIRYPGAQPRKGSVKGLILPYTLTSSLLSKTKRGSRKVSNTSSKGKMFALVSCDNQISPLSSIYYQLVHRPMRLCSPLCLGAWGVEKYDGLRSPEKGFIYLFAFFFLINSF